MIHSFLVRVYYEDTDMAGIVYYANYLRYIERARSDWVKGLGIDQNQMKAEGFVFAVRRVEADYVLPARLDDDLSIETTVIQVTAARLVMDQQVKRDGELVFQATVTVVMINEEGQPARLPANIRRMVH